MVTPISFQELLNEVSDYCRSMLTHSRCENLAFHNWRHTADVVANCSFISQNISLKAHEREELLLAAYFHDMGHIKSADGHETLSSEYAVNFLKRYHFNNEHIQHIKNAIAATTMPQRPNTMIGAILCDGDLAHLGQKSFFTKNEGLRVELHELYDKNFSDLEWIRFNICFLKKHHFHTAFARNYYAAQKASNLMILEQTALKL